MTIDALAALRVWGVTVTIGGKDYQIEPKPAAEWFAAVLDERVFPILTLLGEDDYDELLERQAYEELPMEEFVEASQDALAAASGWQWWSADILIRSAAAEWRAISGEMVKRGLDLQRLPLGAVLNGLYSMATENLDQNQRMSFDMRLSTPPVGIMGEEEREQWAAEAFEAAIREANAGQLPPVAG